MRVSGSMSLIALVYVSTAKQKMTDEELKSILEVSRDNNRKRNISGMLLHRGGFFIQVLEGEQADVEAIYDKIKKDPRHGSILKVYQAKIKERSFADWSMGFNKIEDETLREVEGFTDFLDKPMNIKFFESHPNYAVTLLESFRDRSFF